MYAWIHNIAPSCLRYEIYVHIKKKAWSNHSSQSIDKPKLSHLLLLPGCTAIAGYHTSSDNSNSQQQLMGSYRQKSNSLLAASQPRRVKTTRNGIYLWQFQYDNIIYTIPCTSNGVICGYKTSIRDKRIVLSYIMWNLPKSIGLLQPCIISFHAWTPVTLLDMALAWMWDIQSHTVVHGSFSI